MRGAKMLTWSAGLRDAASLGEEKTDQQLAEEGEAQEPEEIAILPGYVWDGLRHQVGLPCAILDAAEIVSNRTEAAEAVQALVWAHKRPSDPP